MKNRVLSGKLFDMECTHCHSKFHIPYPVLYHDMEKKLLIQFTEEKELEPIKKILDNVNGVYYWNIQNFENPHYVMVLDEKESDKMHFMPFHEGVYKQVEEVFLSDIKQDYIVDASWAVSNTK